MTLIERIVTAMIDYDIDEQHTVGELLHAIRKGQERYETVPPYVSPETEVDHDWL